jgi:hypothetical protein
MAGPREVPELKIRERPPSTLRNVDDGPPGGAGGEGSGAPTINAKKRHRRAPLGGAGAEDPGAATINVKKRQRRAGGGPHLGSKRCVVNLHRYDRQKISLLTGPILSVLSSIMAHDP